MSASHIRCRGGGTNRLKSELVLAKFRPPVYTQLWGDFRYNASALDLALNCGPKTRDILAAGA